MAIESVLVQFATPQTRDTARTAVGSALTGLGSLEGLARSPESVDAAGCVWEFVAPGDVAILPEARAWELAYRIRTAPGVLRAEPTFITLGMRVDDRAADAPLTFGAFGQTVYLAESNDSQWALEKINVPAAWALLAAQRPGEAPGNGIRIGHPDTGYTPHPELSPGGSVDLRGGRNFKEPGAAPIDPLTGGNAGHGTATSSVFLSNAAVAIAPGVRGVSPGATLVPIRMQDVVVHFSWARLVRAIYHAADNDCQVISMSLGGPWGGDSLREAVRYAIGKGVVLVSAAGNYYPFVIHPAQYPEVLAVAGSNARDELWSGSALGADVDITAPGESVWRGHVDLDRRGQARYSVGRGDGTSYATALTAGVCALWQHFHGAALLKQTYGAAVGQVFRGLVQSTARQVPGWPTSKAGPGVLNAEALLSARLPPAPTAPTPLAQAAVHPRLAEIGRLRNETVSQTRAWLTGKLSATSAPLEQTLDQYGAELALLLSRDLIAGPANTVSQPAPLAGRAEPRCSQGLLQALPGI